MIAANPLLRSRRCLGKGLCRAQPAGWGAVQHAPRPKGTARERSRQEGCPSRIYLSQAAVLAGGASGRALLRQVGPPILRARLKASLFFTVSYTPAKVSRGECLPVDGRWAGAEEPEGRKSDWLEGPAGTQRTGLAPR